MLGPRQIGKTTLAKQIGALSSSVYLDLENYQDIAKLSDPLVYLAQHPNKLIILDEVQRKPDIFMSLRSVIDERRSNGFCCGQFLVLGSASLELLQQSSESLAGRIAYIEMNPISAVEILQTQINLHKLWLLGGFPDSLLANSETLSMEWRQTFIKTYLERDVPQFGPRIPATTLYRLWVMLAHLHSTPLQASKLAANLTISSQTVARI